MALSGGCSTISDIEASPKATGKGLNGNRPQSLPTLYQTPLPALFKSFREKLCRARGANLGVDSLMPSLQPRSIFRIDFLHTAAQIHLAVFPDRVTAGSRMFVPNLEGLAALPPTIPIPRFLIGQGEGGHWVAVEADGFGGGIFVDRESALRYALSETCRAEGAIQFSKQPLSLWNKTRGGASAPSTRYLPDHHGEPVVRAGWPPRRSFARRWLWVHAGLGSPWRRWVRMQFEVTGKGEHYELRGMDRNCLNPGGLCGPRSAHGGAFMAAVFVGERTFFILPFAYGARFLSLIRHPPLEGAGLAKLHLIHGAVHGRQLPSSLCDPKAPRLSSHSIREAATASLPISPSTPRSASSRNANWQSYAGETTMSHFTQMAGLTTHNFLDTAVAIALAVGLIRAFSRREFLRRLETSGWI